VLPRPRPAADFALWGLDVDGYWKGEENPQAWTRSADAFAAYEWERLDAFSGVARAAGLLWRQRSWQWKLPSRFSSGEDVWALFDGEWHWASIASSNENDHEGKSNGGKVRGQVGIDQVAHGMHGGPAEPVTGCLEGSVPVGFLGGRCTACDFTVTGITPHFCCKMCAETPGRHGPVCKRLRWRPEQRSRGVFLRWVKDAGRTTTERSRWMWRLENLEVMREEDVAHAASSLAGTDGGDGAEEDPNAVFICNLPLDASAESVSEALSLFGELTRVRVAYGRDASGQTVGRGIGWAVFKERSSAESACAASISGAQALMPEVAGRRLRIAPHRRQHWSHWRHSFAPPWRMQRCIGCGFAVTGVVPQFCCKFCSESPGRHGPACKRLPWRPLHRPRSLSL